MNPSICIDAIFFGTSVPLEEQIRIVKQAGFSTIEFWTWWDKDLATLKLACEQQGVKIHCMCTKFISLVDPSAKQAYLEGLAETLEKAKELSCSNIISQVGNRLESYSDEKQA